MGAMTKSLPELREQFSGVHALPDGTAVPAGLEEALAEHLKHYLPPQDSCPMCGAWRAGARWSIVHGAMQCGSCGYPATMYHFIGEGEARTRVVGFLWAHPDDVSSRDERNRR